MNEDFSQLHYIKLKGLITMKVQGVESGMINAGTVALSLLAILL
ncbi:MULTISPECIES: hypothetical protein [Clostridium]|uniref:Uncharacterized protein n=1 Tax=Clostridium scatologenes TaxID=1548 RepID=A0A0E3GSP3_CLOSL|nr:MULTISPECIES: hypothetical protein [Clostridium]AKA72421.1 hypothetical protein CSCA_5296 [Clostridium scatologenes]